MAIKKKFILVVRSENGEEVYKEDLGEGGVEAYIKQEGYLPQLVKRRLEENEKRKEQAKALSEQEYSRLWHESIFPKDDDGNPILPDGFKKTED